LKNTGVSLIRQAALQMMLQVMETTTATVLAYAMVREAFKTSGNNPLQ
jgi:chaperonin GroEL (HSP60 family)